MAEAVPPPLVEATTATLGAETAAAQAGKGLAAAVQPKKRSSVALRRGAPRFQTSFMALGSCSTAASCSRLVDENGLASSTGGRGRASTWQLQLSHRAVRASTDEKRTGYAPGVAIVHPPNKMPRCEDLESSR